MLSKVYSSALICMFMLTLVSCVKYVDVPVWVCPVPEIPPKELLQTDKNLDNATDDDILKAIVWDVVYLKNRTNTLELLLEGYKKPPTDLYKLLPTKP